MKLGILELILSFSMVRTVLVNVDIPLESRIELSQLMFASEVYEKRNGFPFKNWLDPCLYIETQFSLQMK